MNYLASGVNVVSVTPMFMSVKGNIICSGEMQAASFSGNGSSMTGVTSTLPSTMTADVVGNVTGPRATLSGNVSAAYFLGNGSLLVGVTATLPSTAATDILGNATGARATLSGNVSAAYFLGNGSLLTGMVVSNSSLPKTIAVDLVGNVTGNTATFSGNVSSDGAVFYGNVAARYFSGNGALLTGLVASNSSLPKTIAADMVGNATGNTATFSGNVAGGGAVFYGNVSAAYFSGNGALLTGMFASNSSLPKTIAADIVGNATGNEATFSGNVVGNGAVFYGNVSAAYFSGNGALLAGIVASNSSLPKTIAANMVGNATGNAATFSGNVVGNGAVFYGNVAARYFSGNGTLLAGLVVSNSSLPKTIAANMIGNVTGSAATFSGNVASDGAVFSGDVNAVNLSGSGALLTDIPRSACFVPPSTGLSTSTAGAITYSVPAGWRIYLQRALDTYFTVNSYTIPSAPGSPFTGLPGNVTQTVVTPFAFAPATGLWTGNVKLNAGGTFTTVPADVCGSTTFGTYAGNSNAMMASGVDLISLTGTMPSFGNALTTVYAAYVNPTSGNVSLCVHSTGTFSGLTVPFAANKTYDVKLDKNMTSIVEYSIITTGAAAPAAMSAHYVSETELYVTWLLSTQNGSLEVYYRTIVASNANGYPVYIAKINTVALSVAWWACLCPLGINGSGWNSFGGVSASPDGTKLAVMGMGNAGNSTGFRFRDGAGTNSSYTFSSSGAVYLNECAFILDASTGVPVSGGVLSSWASGGTPVGYNRTSYTSTYTWYPDSSVFTCFGVVADTISTNWGYWSGSAWVTKMTLTDPIGGGVNTKLSFPATNMASGTWGSAPVSRSAGGFDIAGLVGACYAGDGNLWTVVRTAKAGATGSTTVYTYGGNAVTTNPYTTAGAGTMIVYRGKIDPSTCTFAAGTVTGFKTTTADSASGYPVPHVADRSALGPNTMTGNAHVRLVFETRVGSLTMNGVSCTGLLSGTFKVVTMDLSPNVTVTNFKAFAANSTGIQIGGGGSKLNIGPDSDGYFTLAATGVNNWKGGPGGT